MKPDWRERLRHPLSLSLLLHSGLALTLLVFSNHMTPDLPEPPAPLQTRLVGAIPSAPRPTPPSITDCP